MPIAIVPKTTFVFPLSAPLLAPEPPVELGDELEPVELGVTVVTVVCAPLLPLELAPAPDPPALDAVVAAPLAEDALEPELELDAEEPEAEDVPEGVALAPVPRYCGGGTTLDWSTSAPAPQGIFWPSGCVSFAGGVVVPSAGAIVKRVVHVRFLGAAGLENW